MRILKLQILLILIISLYSCKSEEKSSLITNPIYDGYYADPSILKYNDTYYIYATIDPWGADELGVLSSSDFKNWNVEHIGWPTTKLCSSSTSKDAKVWAPSVIQTKSGKFYMYVSVGSEVWVGTSNHPLGPWKNARADGTPLIRSDLYPEYHMIDAEVFIDTDGQAYLYWGSGWNWENGHCFVGKLNDDMVSFEGDIRDITPANYFEAPFMVKHDDKYYLMYSDGKVIGTTYKVRYAIGDSPMGVFKEASNSPILMTGSDSVTVSPGHHSVFEEDNQLYILYHRQSQETQAGNSDQILRELCIDSLNFDTNQQIEKVTPHGVVNFIK